MLIYKYSFIFLRVFMEFQLVLLNDQINVGTVLFTSNDATKKCWNDEQIALLRARLIYQDVLPKTTLNDVKNDAFLNALLKYFHLAIDKVKRLSDVPTQQINLAAMSDVIGGYFRSILIPLTKRAFYSGAINFESTQEVLKFYDSIKLFLHTDGKNWAAPGDATVNRFIRQSPPLNPKTSTITDSCEKLIYNDNNGCINIPTPYFDTKQAPSAIAVPFKVMPLRNLEHKNAINCLFYFYSTAKNCLQEKHASRDNINMFNRDFEKFLDADVLPHLTDEKIYGAFGSVFLIKSEINQKNVEKRTNPTKIVRMVEKTKKVDPRSDDDDVFGAGLQDDDDKAPIIVLVCLCVVTALWLCITLYYCAKNRGNVKIPKATSMAENDGSAAADADGDEQAAVEPCTSSVIKIPEEEQRRCSSLTTANQENQENQGNQGNENAEKRLSFNEDTIDQKKRKKCLVCARHSHQTNPKICPKCKRKHCRCIRNIWSTLSKYTISYPRIFSGKTAAILDNQTKQLPNKSPVAKAPQTHFLVQMASGIPKPPARSIKSAPATTGKKYWLSEDPSRNVTTTGRNVSNATYTTNATNVTNVTNVKNDANVMKLANKEQRTADEKIFVFGYDFETSSSDDSSFTDDSSSDTI